MTDDCLHRILRLACALNIYISFLVSDNIEIVGCVTFVVIRHTIPAKTKQNDVKAIMYYLSSNIHGTFLLLTNEVPFRVNIGIYQVIQKHGHIQKKK
jgi:hypothetical protein